jgi:hypothetical protein
MATKIKLTREQYRQWRQNLAHVRTFEGDFVRYATPEEQHDAFVFAETQKAENNSTRNPTREKLDPHTIEIEGTKHVVRNHQDIVCEQLVAEHGEVLLLDPSNRRLKNLRDPSKVPMSYEQSMGTMPPGDNCECSSWQGRAPGRHHPACSWAKLDRHVAMGTAVAETTMADGRGLRQLAAPDLGFKVAGSTVHLPPSEGGGIATSPGTQVIRPEACICKEWARTPKCKPNGHHSICQHAPAWDRAHPQPMVDGRLEMVEKNSESTIDHRPSTIDVQYIYDMANGRKLREADADEILEAAESLKRDSIPTIEINGTKYVVATESGEPIVDGRLSMVESESVIASDTIVPEPEQEVSEVHDPLDNFLSQLNDEQKKKLVEKLTAP